MAKILKKQINTEPEPELHKGYNEKNPTEPQGAFTAAPMEAPPKPVKKSPRKNKKITD